MKFIETLLKGSYIIKLEPNEDFRGFFARIFDINNFRQHGIEFNIVQSSISYNKKKTTIRGMHYQDKPYEEEKLVQCIKGSIYDVIIDLRNNSPTYEKWVHIELSDKNYDILYVPKGFAHGFQTLEDDTLVLYHMCEFYKPEYAKTIYYKSPKFNIVWPFDNSIMSNKDNINMDVIRNNPNIDY